MSIVTGRRDHFLRRCRERCFTLDEVAACIVSDDGTTVAVDTAHPAYPATPKPGCPERSTSGETLTAEQAAAIIEATPGVGTELKRLLARIGIVATPECKCNKRAMHMNYQGVEWCEANIPEIVGWLREAASDRGLPFMDWVGRRIVLAAIAAEKSRLRNSKGGDTAA